MKLNNSIQTTVTPLDSKTVAISKSIHVNENISKEDINSNSVTSINEISNNGSDGGSEWAKNAKKSIINSISKIKSSKGTTLTKAKNVTPVYTSLISSDIIEQSLANNLVIYLKTKCDSVTAKKDANNISSGKNLKEDNNLLISDSNSNKKVDRIDKVTSSSSSNQGINTELSKESEDTMQIDSCQNESDHNETNIQQINSTLLNNTKAKDQSDIVQSKKNQTNNSDSNDKVKKNNNHLSEKEKSPFKLAEIKKESMEYDRSPNLKCSSVMISENKRNTFTGETINKELPINTINQNISKQTETNDTDKNKHLADKPNENISETVTNSSTIKDSPTVGNQNLNKDNQSIIVNHASKNLRKASLRIAEATKQKESISAPLYLGENNNEIPSNAKSHITSDSDVAEKINEEKKQLRPRAPKRTSNEGNMTNATLDTKTGQTNTVVRPYTGAKRGRKSVNFNSLKPNGFSINIIEAAQCLNSQNRSGSDEEMRLELDDNSNDSNNKEDSTQLRRSSIESNLRNALDLNNKTNKNSETISNSFRKSTTNGNPNLCSILKSSKDSKVVQRENKILFKKFNSSIAFNSTNKTINDRENVYQVNFELANLRTALKITYLNLINKLDDFLYTFMCKSLCVNNLRLSFDPNMSDPNIDPNEFQKSRLKKTIIHEIDRQTNERIKSSQLYSIILQADADFLCVNVYVRYIDKTHFNKLILKLDPDDNLNLEQTRLIKVINIRQFLQASDLETCDIKYRNIKSSALNPSKWSKFLLEQLKSILITTLELEKTDLMCISIDNRVLEKICFPTFQLYLSDFFHDNILIVPSIFISKPLINQFLECKFGDASLEERVFKPLVSFIKYLRDKSFNDLVYTLSVEEMDDFFSKKSIYSCFCGLNLVKLKEIFDFVYVNYSKIVSNLKLIDTENEPNIRTMYTTFYSVDYFSLTCLMFDLCRFLIDYQINPKKFSTALMLKMPWDFEGSYLNNLLCQQMYQETTTPVKQTEADSTMKQEAKSTEKNDPLSVLRNFQGLLNTNYQNSIDQSSKKTINTISTHKFLVSEKSALERLASLKKSIEKIVLDLLDFASETSPNQEKFAYLNYSNDESDDENSDPISMCEIYSFLCQMFEVKLQSISVTNVGGDFKFKFNPDENLLESNFNKILVYYQFQKLIKINVAKTQYKEFFESFFETATGELKAELETSKQQNFNSAFFMSKSLMDLSLSMKRKFIDFVHQSNLNEVWPTITFFAFNYLILPPILDFREPINSREFINTTGETPKSPLSTQEITSLEQKLKIVIAIDGNYFDQEITNLDEISNNIDELIK